MESDPTRSAATLLPSECPNCGHLHKGHDFTEEPGPIQAENRRLRGMLADVHQYTVEPRWTQEERLKAIRDVVARSDRGR